MPNGSNYTVKDLVYYAALIAGMATTSVTLRYLTDWHWVVRIIISLVVGLALGYAAEFAFRKLRGPGRPPSDDSSPNQGPF